MRVHFAFTYGSILVGNLVEIDLILANVIEGYCVDKDEYDENEHEILDVNNNPSDYVVQGSDRINHLEVVCKFHKHEHCSNDQEVPQCFHISNASLSLGFSLSNTIITNKSELLKDADIDYDEENINPTKESSEILFHIQLM